MRSALRRIRTISFTKKQIRNTLFALLLVLISVLQNLIVPQPAKAATATGYLMLDRMKINTTTGGSVCFNPTASETTVREMSISFADNSGTQGTAAFGVNATGSNWTWDTTSIPPGTSAFPGTPTTSTVSGGTVTFIVTADQSLTAGTTYCLHFTGTSTLTTPTNANSDLTGTIELKNVSDALLAGEQVNYATASLSNEQIVVTATVPATFSFALGGNTAALGTLSSSSVVSDSGVTVTVSTNANNGWIGWVKSASAALTSASTSDSIPSAAFTTGAGNVVDLASNTGYELDANATTGSPTIATEYDGTNTTSGGNLSTSFEKFASKSTSVSGNVVTLVVRVKPTGTTKAATDYTDTLTVVGAGSF